MDPHTLMLLLQLLSKEPPSPPTNVGNVSPPSTVDVAALQSSFADLARGILHCYHPSARYQLADIVQEPWDRQQQYSADASALIRIQSTRVFVAGHALGQQIINACTQVFAPSG